MMAESLTLKWGTLKGWHLESDKAIEIMKRYVSEGSSMSAMDQNDTPAQKQAICDLIDAIDGPIYNDWTGKEMPKDEAKGYIMNYSR
jgi:hypothetical protein